MARASFTDVTSALVRAGIPTRELAGSGHVTMTLAAGRIVAIAFTRNGPNLLWSNTQLSDTETMRDHPEKLVGGIGGDRLWFSPELDYYWKGAPDWKNITNYEVPAAADPGSYTFDDSQHGSIALHNAGQLVNRANGRRTGFEVSRTIRMTPSPLADNDPLRRQIDYVGVETSHVLQFVGPEAGRLDLWHLLQVPVGSVLIVPYAEDASTAAKTPVSYALPGGWIERPDKLLWRYGGTAQAKIGLSASALTGRTAVLQQLGSEYCLIIRKFSVDENAKYADHPYGEPRTDQAFQAWDGMGFGEMEYHCPMLDAQSGPRMLRESDQLWAFGGEKTALLPVAERLLHTDISDAFMLLDTSL